MRRALFIVALALIFSTVCIAQEYEVGGAVGYGAYHNASIGNPFLGETATAGFHPGVAAGVWVGENMYEYIGGEIRYLFLAGSPELQFQGTRATMDGYSNLVVYDLLFHLASRDKKLRPFFAGGAGVRIDTGTELFLAQPLLQFAVLRPGTHVEPAISAGGGLKYVVHRHILLRADFRAYMSPLPHQLFRTTALSVIRGWTYNFVPQLGLGYTF
jgi:hypothetical protein